MATSTQWYFLLQFNQCQWGNRYRYFLQLIFPCSTHFKTQCSKKNINPQISKYRNNKFGCHNLPPAKWLISNRFSLENRLAYLNTKFQKRGGKTMDLHQLNAKAQLNYIRINKKLINSAPSCEAYSSFEGISSDHRITSEKIRPSQRKNKTETAKSSCYDWYSLTKSDISNQYSNCKKHVW